MDSDPPASERSPVVRRTVIKMGVSRETEVAELPASGTSARSNTFWEAIYPAGS